MEKWDVGILIFDGVEVLDLAGPFEVLSRTRLVPGTESRRTDDSAPFNVFTVASTTEPVTATGGLVVVPNCSFATCPPVDLLVVPGGFGTRPLLQDEETVEWIRTTSAAARQTASVCTGSLLLARAGLLDGRRATTHWGAFGLLESLGKNITLDRESRFVEDGVMTSAGVASGIDLAFHLVQKLLGREVADETARYIEYERG